jgi:hypothetical protein
VSKATSKGLRRQWPTLQSRRKRWAIAVGWRMARNFEHHANVELTDLQREILASMFATAQLRNPVAGPQRCVD